MDLIWVFIRLELLYQFEILIVLLSPSDLTRFLIHTFLFVHYKLVSCFLICFSCSNSTLELSEHSTVKEEDGAEKPDATNVSLNALTR